jgi:hypothetical protein
VLTLLLYFLESSGYQCQDKIKYSQQYPRFSFLGDTQILIHIFQGVKATIPAQNAIRSFQAIEGIICMVCKDYNGLMAT